MPDDPTTIHQRILERVTANIGRGPAFDVFDAQRQRDLLQRERQNRRAAQRLGFEGIDVEDELQKGRGPTLLTRIFDVVSRPSFAVAGAVEEVREFGGVGDVAGRIGKELFSGLPGVEGEKRTFGDLLRDAGGGKTESALGGFALDVALDPLTYLGPGLFKLGAKGISKIPGLTRAGQAIKASGPAQALGRTFIPNFELKQLGDVGQEIIKAQEKFLRIAPQREAALLASSIRSAVDGATPKQLTQIIDELASGIDPSDLPGELKFLWDNSQEVFEEMATLEVRAGVLDPNQLIENYIPQRLPEDERLMSVFSSPRRGKQAFQKKRTLELGERIEAGIPTERNIATLMGIRGAESIRARTTSEFTNHVLSNTDIAQRVTGNLRPDQIPEGMSLFMPQGGLRFFYKEGVIPSSMLKQAREGGQAMIEVGLDDLQSVLSVAKAPVFMMPEEIARTLNSVNKQFISDEATTGLLRTFDKVLNVWKGHATAVNPGFHFRNMYSNWFNAHLAGVSSPQPFKIAQRIQSAVREPGLKTVATDGGQKILGRTLKGTPYSYADVLEEALDRGVYNMGWFGADIPETLNQIIQGSRRLSANPFSRRFALLQKGRQYGTAIENNSRLAVFVDQLKKGKSLDEAAATTKKFLFDYGDLTPFEQNVMKRIVPFYTWMRKNIPLQIEMLARQPQKFANVAKAFNEIQGTVEDIDRIDPSDLSAWMKDLNVVQIPSPIAQSQMFFNPNLPFQDLNNLMSLRENVASINPILKVPLEIATNRNIFFGKDVEEYAGQQRTTPELEFISQLAGHNVPIQVPSRVAHVLTNVSPFFRNIAQSIPATAELATGEADPYPVSRLISTLLGIKFIPFQKERARANRAFRESDVIEALRRGQRDTERLRRQQ